jgi:putative transposase
MLRELAICHTQWGFWMMHYHLRSKGYKWNHKRVYRIYSGLGLNLRRKYRKRLPSRIKEPLLQPLIPNLTWSMDFMEDRLENGRKLRTFNIIDDFNREALNITLDSSIASGRVIRELEKTISWRGKPEQIRVDNGPEFIAQRLAQWCDEHGIKLKFIQKGKPSQNGYVERFNRTYREEVLSNYCFKTMTQARLITQAWMWVYNNERPHKSLGYLTPVAFLLKYGYRHISLEQLNSHGGTIPTLQQNSNNDWKSLILNVAN